MHDNSRHPAWNNRIYHGLPLLLTVLSLPEPSQNPYLPPRVVTYPPVIFFLQSYPIYNSPFHDGLLFCQNRISYVLLNPRQTENGADIYNPLRHLKNSSLCSLPVTADIRNPLRYLLIKNSSLCSLFFILVISTRLFLYQS